MNRPVLPAPRASPVVALFFAPDLAKALKVASHLQVLGNLTHLQLQLLGA